MYAFAFNSCLSSDIVGQMYWNLLYFGLIMGKEVGRYYSDAMFFLLASFVCTEYWLSTSFDFTNHFTVILLSISFEIFHFLYCQVVHCMRTVVTEFQ